MSYTGELPEAAIAAHDLARDLPEGAWDEVIGGLVEQRRGTGQCVDVGIGSGAVGGRLARRGLDVIGVDCNESMLAALRAKYPEVTVAIGDAAALPIAGHQADLVVMAWVLHLIYDWQAALREAVRIGAEGALLAINIGQSGISSRTGVGQTFLEELAKRVTLAPMPGPRSIDEVRATLLELGCEALGPVATSATVRRSVRDYISRLEWNPFAWPPGTPQSALSAAAEATRAEAERRLGTIDAANPAEATIGFHVYRLNRQS